MTEKRNSRRRNTSSELPSTEHESPWCEIHTPPPPGESGASVACRQQQAHGDRGFTGAFAGLPLEDVPLSVLYAIEDGTRIFLEGKEYSLPTGSLLLFRGDLCHSGACYESCHTRVHMYLDPQSMRRTDSQFGCPSAGPSD